MKEGCFYPISDATKKVIGIFENVIGLQLDIGIKYDIRYFRIDDNNRCYYEDGNKNRMNINPDNRATKNLKKGEIIKPMFNFEINGMELCGRYYDIVSISSYVTMHLVDVENMMFELIEPDVLYGFLKSKNDNKILNMEIQSDRFINKKVRIKNFKNSTEYDSVLKSMLFNPEGFDTIFHKVDHGFNIISYECFSRDINRQRWLDENNIQVNFVGDIIDNDNCLIFKLKYGY